MDEQCKKIVAALFLRQSKVILLKSVEVSLTKYKFIPNRNEKEAIKIAEEIVQTLYGTVQVKEEKVKSSTKKKKGTVVNGIRYII